MELFRIGGLSSEHMMQQGTAMPQAFHGSMFKMGTPPPQSPEGQALAEKAAEDAAIAEAVAGGGQPLDPQEAADDQKWTAKDLAALTKEKLVELASSMGVADVSGSKAQISERILAAQ